MLENKESFIGSELFRKCLNSVQSLADFVLDAAKEHKIRVDLLENKVQREDESNHIGNRGLDSEISSDETLRFRREARSYKLYRLSFFNSADVIKLPLSGVEHDTNNYEIERYCALCGNFCQSGTWRGHIYSFCCHLATCIYV
jgi:hypothetical protein